MTSFDTPTEPIDADEFSDIVSPPDPLLGQVLDSRNELIARLGEGGMGITYRMAFSPDGKTLAGASDGTVKLWDVSGVK